MGLRAGRRAAIISVEVQPLDEQSRGVPQAAPVDAANLSAVRAQSLAKVRHKPTAEEAKRIGRMGGLASKAAREKLKAIEGLGLLGADPGVMRPYIEAANEWAQSEITRLARQVGGGIVEANVAALVQGAALALAASRYCYAQAMATGDTDMLKLGKELQQASRQETLAAREVCVKDAQARPKSDPVADMRARIRAGRP